MQKGLDRPRHTVGILQEKHVAGLFNQTDFDIRQQCQQLARRFHRHQPVEAGEQMQLRTAERMQRLSCIQLREHLQTTQQHRRSGVRGTAEQQPRQSAWVFGALGAKQ
ncbi:hypothetical protein D3C79_882710 [compost metagenome]